MYTNLKKVQKKLNLDSLRIEQARNSAKRIVIRTQEFIDKHTTTTIERTVCRLLEIDGADKFGVPLPNIIVEDISKANKLNFGAANFIGSAMLHDNLTPQELAEQIARKEININKIEMAAPNEIREIINKQALKTIEKIENNKKFRDTQFKKFGEKTSPLLYVIVATGNIYEDITQAKAAVRQGADVIAVIRSTGQSLLDYVPYGATTEGFGGTYATQENFRLMRKALDEVGEEEGKYIRLTNYCSGLCMPEIAALGALERLDMMLNDALYGILFRDINMKRTMIDQYFSRMINAFAGIIINTGEDNYIKTNDSYENAHTVLTSQFMNEQFALFAGLKEEQIGLGHSFELDPSIKNGFLYELAQAQMAREIFPKCPLKYMPPTRYMTGNIFMGHVQDALFNIITILTNQKIHLLGMLTEAMHTPFMSDRALSIENAQYIFNNMADFGDEIYFKEGGVIQSRAEEVLKKAIELLKGIEKIGIFKTIEQGIFGGIRRSIEGGKGLEGVVLKDKTYYNPFIDIMSQKLFEVNKSG